MLAYLAVPVKFLFSLQFSQISIRTCPRNTKGEKKGSFKTLNNVEERNFVKNKHVLSQSGAYRRRMQTVKTLGFYMTILAEHPKR